MQPEGQREGELSDLEEGKQVFAPSDKSKKRKRPAEPKQSRKKSKKFKSTEDDFIDDNDEENERSASESEGESDKSDNDSSLDEDQFPREPLTIEMVEEKLAQFKEDKKRARNERTGIDHKSKEVNQEIKALEKSWDEIDTSIRALGIEGRNAYSKGTIQQDFAAGIKKLD